MIYDLQKGSLLKRASAFLLDGILLVILVTGFFFALSAVVGLDGHINRYDAIIDRYSEEFDINYSSFYAMSEEDFAGLTELEKSKLEAFKDAVENDPEISGEMIFIVTTTMTLLSISIFLSFLVIEFVFPMIFKNGQTVGKKIFGLGVMRTNGVRIRGVSLFARTFLGKYIVETMVPVLVVIMFVLYEFGMMPSVGLFGPIILMCLFVTQVILLFWTKKHTMIHDIVSDCVVVDLGSQMIFDSEQARTEYIARKAAEEAAVSPY